MLLVLICTASMPSWPFRPPMPPDTLSMQIDRGGAMSACGDALGRDLGHDAEQEIRDSLARGASATDGRRRQRVDDGARGRDQLYHPLAGRGRPQVWIERRFEREGDGGEQRLVDHIDPAGALRARTGKVENDMRLRTVRNGELHLQRHRTRHMRVVVELILEGPGAFGQRLDLRTDPAFVVVNHPVAELAEARDPVFRRELLDALDANVVGSDLRAQVSGTVLGKAHVEEDEGEQILLQ